MKKKTNISDKALALINKKKIMPKPKWEFVAKNWGLWLGFGVCFGLVIMALGITWFGLADNIITPYMWLMATIVFFGLSFVIFEKTKNAYRFQKWQVIGLMAVMGIIFGSVFFKIGLASRVDRGLESRFGFYRQMVPMRLIVWNNPEQGYLSGKIIRITDSNDFEIQDFDGNMWRISGNNPIIRGRVSMTIGEEIKLIGNKTGNKSFAVDEIRPWNGRMMPNMMKENY